MSTPERQDDPGRHGYGGIHDEKSEEAGDHALEDPRADPSQDEGNENSDDRDRAGG
jgi:hypothetical protein